MLVFFSFFNLWRIKRKLKYLLNPNLYQKFENEGQIKRAVCLHPYPFIHLHAWHRQDSEFVTLPPYPNLNDSRCGMKRKGYI